MIPDYIQQQVWKNAGVGKCQICKGGTAYLGADYRERLHVVKMRRDVDDRYVNAFDCLLLCSRCRWFVTVIFDKFFPRR